MSSVVVGTDFFPGGSRRWNAGIHECRFGSVKSWPGALRYILLITVVIVLIAVIGLGVIVEVEAGVAQALSRLSRFGATTQFPCHDATTQA